MDVLTCKTGLEMNQTGLNRLICKVYRFFNLLNRFSMNQTGLHRLICMVYKSLTCQTSLARIQPV